MCKCLLGASLVHPRCILGASSVHPCTRRLGPRALFGRQNTSRILIKIKKPPPVPAISPKPPGTTNNALQAIFFTIFRPMTPQKCSFLLPTWCMWDIFSNFWCLLLPFLLQFHGCFLYFHVRPSTAASRKAAKTNDSSTFLDSNPTTS